MESSSLFNPGFLGSSFNWWVGQITDDDHWRDNIVLTKMIVQRAQKDGDTDIKLDHWFT